MKKKFSGPPPRRKKADGTFDTASKRKSKPTPAEPKIELVIKPKQPNDETIEPKPAEKEKSQLEFKPAPIKKPRKIIELPSVVTAKKSDKPKLQLDLPKSVSEAAAEYDGELPNYVVGRRAAIELLKSDSEREKVEKVYLAHGTQGPQISEILHFLRVNKIAHTELDRRRFSELERTASAGTDTQGVIVLLNVRSYWELEDLIPEASLNGRVVLIALDGIEDPHNIGAIIRSAEALGANGIMLPKRGAVLTPAVYKTSAGAALHLPIVKIGNLAETLSTLKEQYGFFCIGLAGEADKTISEIQYEGNICLLIGGEEKGLHQLTRKRCDELVKIPMTGKTESLNASVAAALAMYEVLKEKNIAE